MYPKSFTYHRPQTVADAVRLLSDLGDSARPLAGGQSLIPILKLRMDEPTDLVDIGRLYELMGIENDDGEIRIGALATHARIARSDIGRLVPSVRDCAGGIADHQVRSLGTIGGSVSVADPSSDWPALLFTLDARVICVGPHGSRSVAIEDFIVDSYTTVLAANELVTEIRFDVPPPLSGGAYIGFKKAAPAYPAASVGIQLTLGADEICESVRLALGSAGPRPVTSTAAESALRGEKLTETNLQQAAALIVDASSPPSDSRGSTAFKRAVLTNLFMKAANTAIKRCRGEQIPGSHDYV